MRSVERAEFEAQVARMVTLVKEGETVVVLEDGREVGRFVAPPPPIETGAETEEEILDRLEREGRIKRGTGPDWTPRPIGPMDPDSTATNWLIGEGRDDRA